jgi:hypothetical protein
LFPPGTEQPSSTPDAPLVTSSSSSSPYDGQSARLSWYKDTMWDSNKNYFAFLRSLRRLLVTANVFSSSIIVTLIIETQSSSETSFFSRATRRNVPEDDIIHNCSTSLQSINLCFLVCVTMHRLRESTAPVCYEYTPRSEPYTLQ